MTNQAPLAFVKMNGIVNAFLRSDKGMTYIDQNALQAVGGSPEDLKAFVAAELKKWKPVIETANISIQ